ncbi:MAG: PAS domain-containing protein [Pseudorhodoferax sp.]
MWLRFTSFVVLLLAGAGMGWWLRGWPAACAGMLLAGLAWWLADLARALRVLRSLRDGDTRNLPRMGGGLWGEFADRLRRACSASASAASRTASAGCRSSSRRIQASSNGVILLDAEGRINWCNPTAAAHFGIDTERDHDAAASAISCATRPSRAY